MSASVSPAFAAAEKTEYKFDFASGQPAPGYIHVPPTAVYSDELGYGFDLGSKVTAVDHPGENGLRGGFVTSNKPFYFSVAVPEGNYGVTVVFGDWGKPRTPRLRPNRAA